MDISDSERKLLLAFRDLGTQPNVESKDDLKRWLEEYHDGEDLVQDDDDDEDDTEIKTVIKSTNIPKISIFYGDIETLTKGEVFYDQWRYEVRSLKNMGYSDDIILQAIKRSLKGGAARVLKRFRDNTSIDNILKKFDSVYGSSESKSTILKNFHGASQDEKETITEWSCRLEELLDTAIDHKLVLEEEANDMLCQQFWTGMIPELRDITGYKFENTTDFDELRQAVKEIEKRHKAKKELKSQTTSKSATSFTDDSAKDELKELRGMMKTVVTRMDNIQEDMKNMHYNISSQQVQHGGRQEEFNRNERRDRSKSTYHDGARARSNSRYRTDRQEDYRQQDLQNSRRQDGNQRPRNDFDQRRTSYQGYNDRRKTEYRPSYNDGYRNVNSEGPLCYRCRQHGHFQWQCKTRMDHSKN